MSRSYELSVKCISNEKDAVNVTVSLGYKDCLYGEILTLHVHVDKAGGKDLSYYEFTAINKACELLKDIASEL